MNAFHEIRFPEAISFGSSCSVERQTEIVALASGHEIRNARQRNSRRRYNAGYGVKSLSDLHRVIVFFEERRGRLHGFRWKDPLDHSSATPGRTPTDRDQILGKGDGETAAFQLVKTYSDGFNPWRRRIVKPVAKTVKIAVAAVAKTESSHFDIDISTGIVTFKAGHIPAVGQTISCGFEFDVPVRFDADRLDINLTSFEAGDIPSIPIIALPEGLA